MGSMEKEEEEEEEEEEDHRLWCWHSYVMFRSYLVIYNLRRIAGESDPSAGAAEGLDSLGWTATPHWVTIGSSHTPAGEKTP